MFARYFKEWDLGRWQIFLDSPMAIEATKIYMKHVQLYDETAAAFWREHGTSLSLPNLTFSRTADESRKIKTQPLAQRKSCRYIGLSILRKSWT